MGKFKEIDMDLDNYVFYKKSTMCFVAVILLICLIVSLFNGANKYKLEENIKLIEQDRTELITENKHLQEENRALKSIVETYRIPNNSDTREE